MTVHSKSFADVPLDPDTKIIEQHEISINSLPCLFQRWSWESINASSCIFHTFDVQSFSDDQLQALIAESELSNTLGTKTISRKDNFTFVNFNFQY
tara:strand:+ start:4289 stop:4576 length:288 start_codon:yes stop_codon:yes gene_type:complete